MAEALVQVLIENLTSLIKKEIGSIMGVEKEMKKLQSTLTTLQSVLEDAEGKQLHNKPIQNWLSKLNDAAYEIEDILDECTTERRRSRFNLKKISFERKIGRRMKEMTERLDGLAAERRNFHLREIDAPQFDCRRETGFILNEPSYVYGRDEDNEMIVHMLVNKAAACEQLTVLPVIGVGGLGKTTLAQLVFNDGRVSRHFDTKIWVSVSDNFDIKALLKAIIEFGHGSAVDLMHVAALQQRLWAILNQKRYLLVLDDVWNENQESWAMLKSVLDCGSKGASVVVTTRMQKVGDIMGTVPPYCLKGLSEEHCWLLFKSRAFGQESEEQQPLNNIGRQIVRKCAGVPLAAKALGGLLRFKREEKEWIHVEKSEIWNLPEEETAILPALRLSYHHLPLALRRCFVYCAVFQKDSEIEKKNLIFCWMAHGCISSNGMQDVEDVGDRIWNELVLRSFFQEVKTRGRRTTFKMHDLFHDLAQSIIANKACAEQMENSRVREVCFNEHSTHSCSIAALKVSTLTTITNYTRLRILKLNRARVEKLPAAIGKLKYMRFLDLSSSHIRALPRTFCRLWNLRIIILNDCHHLETLPKNIRYMTNLRHIFLDGCYKLSDTPCRIGELSSLKTLSLFIVGHKVDSQLDQLQLLNIGGRLEIRHLERTKDHMNAKKANLVVKPDLRDLVLSWEGNGASMEESSRMMFEKVLEALEPHLNLETLEMSGFEGSYFPPWMTKMENLAYVSIQDCRYCCNIPIGDLPRLKSLYLQSLNGLENIVDEHEIRRQSSIFPSLEKLRLVHLPNLKELVKESVQGEMMFPNLQELYIQECEMLTLPPSLPKLERLTIGKCSPLTASSFSKAKLENLTYLHLEFVETNTTTRMQEDAWKGLHNLRKLKVWNAREQHLPEKWYQGLKSLKDLEIRNCEIGSTCLQHLIALEKLWIQDCPDYDVRDLHALKHLAFLDLSSMVSLPQGLQDLPSLQSLTLGGLGELSSLPEWFGNLTPLTYLKIHSCPMITSLPFAIQEMVNLAYLGIGNCPQLQRRCEKVKGEDWPKIAHIPQLDFFN